LNTVSHRQVTLSYLLMIVCSLAAIYPLVGVVLASLYPSGPGSAPSGFALPPSFEWHNYVTAWQQGKFASSFTTSIIVAAVMVPASVGLSILGGFAFATMRFRGSRAIFYLFILVVFIVFQRQFVRGVLTGAVKG
jgi:raffinose/stachyose/melibiose transport system permease protein